MNKVCIYGAGAIGAWIGVRLGSAGCQVSVVARGATLEAIRTHGLRLESGGKTVSTAWTPATTHRRSASRTSLWWQ